jgi:hypothetical protein
MTERADIVIVGAGAAGLMAAIAAGRTAPAATIIALDGARTIGAKILVAGGGRCNVTHHAVDASAYAGDSRNAIAKVLRQFDVEHTVDFFRELGVELKREPTGKLFPVTDSARTVLNALLYAAHAAGVDLRFPRRVHTINAPDTPAPASADNDAFHIAGDDVDIRARRVIIATGGRSLPKSGSDGFGYTLVKNLGHTITDRVFPSLVPLTLDPGHPLCALSGIATDVTLTVRAGSGKHLASFTDAMLCTHFGLSGPAVLDVSRYFLDAKMDDPDVTLLVNWLPTRTFNDVDAQLQRITGAEVAARLSDQLPRRLVDTLIALAGVTIDAPRGPLPRESRRSLAHTLVETPLPITGDRGFTYAEVTAGGVPLREIELNTMASRFCAGLHLCGEICNVDGRIGGFNFQWAWASGTVAGKGCAQSLCTPNT